MAHLDTDQELSSATQDGAAHRKKWIASATAKKLALGFGALCILVVIASAVMVAKWPFTKEGMTKRLEQLSSAKVEVRGFRKTFFPLPGCVLEDVTFHLPPADGVDATVTIRKLKIQTTFLGFFKPNELRKVVAVGLRVHLPTSGSTFIAKAGTQDKISIDQLIADDAVLEFVSAQSGSKPLVFQIHRVAFSNVNSRNTIPFEVSLQLPLFPGEVKSYGWIGPAAGGKPIRSTPISGAYVFTGGNLGIFESLAGKISSQGNFSGNLGSIAISGKTDCPDFEVKTSKHPFHVSTQFRGAVDLKNGDVALSALQARLGNTKLIANARVYGYPKTIALNVTQGSGNIQDLILLFSSAPRSPVTGPVVFHTNAVLPPEDRPFKERVQLAGDFKINPAQFTSANTQEHVDQLSERAQGKKDDKAKMDKDPGNNDPAGFDRVLTDLKGNVLLKNGVASFARTSFSVPGAHGEMNGNYSLLNKKVAFHGKMRMQATVSEATTGMKSFILKVADPFFKKKNAGAEVAIHMTGTYDKPEFGAGLK
jgi:AsmA-like C-terminal region